MICTRQLPTTINAKRCSSTAVISSTVLGRRNRRLSVLWGGSNAGRKSSGQCFGSAAQLVGRSCTTAQK